MMIIANVSGKCCGVPRLKIGGAIYDRYLRSIIETA
jgi:hypothetical protein